MHSLLRVLGMLVPALLATTFSVTYLLQRHIVRLASRYLPRVLFFVRVANRDSPKLVALTIDDGIDADITPSVLRLLKRYGAGATFFIIGDHVTQAGDVGPKLLSEAVAVGCELGNHTWFDRATWKLSTATLRKELREVDDLITHAHLDAQLPVPRLKWFRPGHGFFNKRMLQAAEEAGYRTALGDVFPYDHAVSSWRLNSWMVLHNVAPGSVLVLHDRRPWLLPTLEAVLRELTQVRGYKVVTLSELWWARTAP